MGALLSGLYQVRTYDTFFHLATGRAIAQLGHVPETDIFSFTVRGAPWVNHSPGFQLFLYGLQSRLGFVGVSLWQAAIALALFALPLATVARHERAYGGAIALLPFVTYREVLEARPHALGFACLSAWLVLALRAPGGPTARQGLVLLAIYAVFCSAHGSHLLVLFVCASAATLALFARRRAELGRWTLLLIGCAVVAVCLQPEAFRQGTQHLSSEFLESNVAEWRPLTPSDLTTSGKGIAFLSCLGLSLMGLVAALKEAQEQSASRLVLALFGVFALFSLSSRRMLALFLFGAAPLWLPLATHAAALLLERASHALGRAAIAGAAVSALLAHLALADAPFRLGVGLDQARFPSGAVARLHASDAPRRVFNAYNFGGYLAWMETPRAGVFVDGRAITVYPPDFLALFEQAYVDARVFELLRARFALDGVLMPHASPRVQKLLRYLAAHPSWRELHRDELSVLYGLQKPTGQP